MAARTAITVQTLDTKGGEVITFVAADAGNGMQFASTGREIVLVKAAAASSVNVTFPSVACSHGRTGDVTGSVAASEEKAFGPFTDPTIFGDGASLGYVDFAAVVGTITVAVVRM